MDWLWYLFKIILFKSEGVEWGMIVQGMWIKSPGFTFGNQIFHRNLKIVKGSDQNGFADTESQRADCLLLTGDTENLHWSHDCYLWNQCDSMSHLVVSYSFIYIYIYIYMQTWSPILWNSNYILMTTQSVRIRQSPYIGQYVVSVFNVHINRLL